MVLYDVQLGLKVMIPLTTIVSECMRGSLRWALNAKPKGP
jgi:hypothetical protein